MIADDFYYDILDHGFVSLIDKMGTDLTPVNAARVSFAKRSEELGESDVGLLGFMMRERHGSPFEHIVAQFHIKAPIFVAREWFRHRIGSFNEQSGRYSKLEGEFYLPESENVRTQVGKPGAYVFNVLEEQKAAYAREEMLQTYHTTWQAYEYLLEEGVAKEVARMVLPVGIYTQWWWTVNARSLMNFLSLRMDQHAQYEIRMYANAVAAIFADLWPCTYQAFIDNGRVAP